MEVFSISFFHLFHNNTLKETAIRKTLAINIDDNDDKAEAYSYLIDKVYKKYIVSIKGLQPSLRPSMRFKLLLAMMIIGSKRSRLFLIAFHYMSEWQWIKDDGSFFTIMLQLLHHYLISVFDYHIDVHNANLSNHSNYLTGLINKVLSKTMLSTFNDIKFHESVARLKHQCLQILSSNHPHLVINEFKRDNDINQFCTWFELWARRVFSIVSTSNQYCYDFEKFVVEEDTKSAEYVQIIFDPTLQIGRTALDIIHEVEETSSVIDYEMELNSNDGGYESLVSFHNAPINKQENLIEETKYEQDEEEQVENENVELNLNFGHKITALFRIFGAIMDQDDDSSCNTNV